MKIELKNTITIDDQVEIFQELYEGELVEKAGWVYLIYQNGDQEKVVLKCREDQVIMTRFGNPQTQMRFLKGGQGPAAVPTPMGLQRLVTQTQGLTLTETTLKVTYDLLTDSEGQQALASYDLLISWEK